MEFQMIKDNETRIEIDKLKKRISEIEAIGQLPKDSTVEQVVDAINRITKSTKRKR
jgi:KaiC/GvpD/RAD55 family RecA-like ATPase